VSDPSGSIILVSLAPYRQVLAVPGVRALLLVGLLARVPATAIAITVTLHVVNVLGGSWAQAGAVTAAYTIGAAVGQPIVGRLMDRRGLRLVLGLTTVVTGVVWAVAPSLPYAPLLVVVAIGGLFGIPIFGSIRLALGATVPADSRRPAFALDSMITELSYMVGPAVAVLLATGLPAGFGLYALAGGQVVAGTALWLFNPPTRPEGHAAPAVAPSRRSWLTPRLVVLMVSGFAATFVLSSSELSVVANMRNHGLQQFTGIAIALWCAYSLVGGLIFGMVTRPVATPVIVAVMALLTMPVGLVPAWPWVLVALIPCGLLCAPTMAASNAELTRIVPAESRGEANGLAGALFTAGIAAGAPAAGLIIDAFGPAWALAACSALGAVAVLVALPAYRRSALTRVNRSTTADASVADAEAVPAGV
jgi:MFS family permease